MYIPESQGMTDFCSSLEKSFNLPEPALTSPNNNQVQRTHLIHLGSPSARAWMEPEFDKILLAEVREAHFL